MSNEGDDLNVHHRESITMAVIKIRIEFEGNGAIGHGRIELLELIEQHGSIAQAAKAMMMSYKRAWYLIDEFNSMFSDPLVERRHGGRGGGAATLTPLGAEIVAEYRGMEAKARSVFTKPLASIEKHIARPRKSARKSGAN
jgi:molybdate transport system regulatory protein